MADETTTTEVPAEGASLLGGTPAPTTTEPLAGQSGAPEPSTFDFRAAIPTELASEACLADIPDYGTMVKNYVHAQKAMGSSVQIPGTDATPEQVAAFRAKMGVPEQASGYKPAFDAAGLQFDETNEATTKLADAARGLGITPEAFTGIIKAYGEITGESEQVLAAQNAVTAEQTVMTLRTEWGATYDQNLGLAQQVVQTFGGPELAQALTATGAGNHPAVIKMFAQLGATMASEGFIDGSAVGAMSRDDALAQAQKLMTEDAYMVGTAPGHQAAVDQVEALFKVAYPESSSDGYIS